MWRIATKSHEMQSPKSLLQRSGASISIDGCVKLENIVKFYQFLTRTLYMSMSTVMTLSGWEASVLRL